MIVHILYKQSSIQWMIVIVDSLWVCCTAAITHGEAALLLLWDVRRCFVPAHPLETFKNAVFFLCSVLMACIQFFFFFFFFFFPQCKEQNISDSYHD